MRRPEAARVRQAALRLVDALYDTKARARDTAGVLADVLAAIDETWRPKEKRRYPGLDVEGTAALLSRLADPSLGDEDFPGGWSVAAVVASYRARTILMSTPDDVLLAARGPT